MGDELISAIRRAGENAPAEGLYLVRVLYPSGAFTAETTIDRSRGSSRIQEDAQVASEPEREVDSR